MTGRDSDSEHTNGGSTRPRSSLEDIPTRILIEDLALRSELHDNRLTTAIEDSQRRDARLDAKLDANGLALARIEAKLDDRLPVVERGVLELVAANRDRQREIMGVQKEVRSSLSGIREELKRDGRSSKTEEQLQEIGIKAGEAFIQVRKAEVEDQLVARKEGRALVLTGARRVGVLVAPILTAAVAAAVVLIAKGC